MWHILFLIGLAGITHAAGPACSSSPYSSLLYLSSCSEAVAFCTSYYRLSACYTTTTVRGTQTVTVTSVAHTVSTTTTVTSGKAAHATTTVTSVITSEKDVTKTVKTTATSVTAVAKRNLQERQEPASCSSGQSILGTRSGYADTICPCIEPTSTCMVRTTEIDSTVTTTVPITTTKTITKVITNTITSQTKTVLKTTVDTETSTLTSTVTKVQTIHPCKSVTSWPTYGQSSFCDGYFELAGKYFNVDLQTCCLHCFNTYLCASFGLDGTTCNIFQNDVMSGSTSNPQCPYGIASESNCQGTDFTVYLGPCGSA